MLRDSREGRSCASDGVTAADAGEHFPERVEDSDHGSHRGGGVVVDDVLRKHGAFSVGD